MLRCEHNRGINIVVEAIINRRTDSKLSLGVKSFYRLSSKVGCGVAIGPLAVIILKG